MLLLLPLPRLKTPVQRVLNRGFKGAFKDAKLRLQFGRAAVHRQAPDLTASAATVARKGNDRQSDALPRFAFSRLLESGPMPIEDAKIAGDRYVMLSRATLRERTLPTSWPLVPYACRRPPAPHAAEQSHAVRRMPLMTFHVSPVRPESLSRVHLKV